MPVNVPATEPIPVTILSGFLGSGKTTLLNQLLRSGQQRNIAVVVNEFGAVGIDGAMISGGEYFVELDNGCLCCALNEDLKTTLMALVQKGPFDHILIETTGLADPNPVAWACTRPELSAALRVHAVVTVWAACFEVAFAHRHPEALAQVEAADVLLINKIDLISDGGKQIARDLQAINPLAPQLFCSFGQLPWQWLDERIERALPTTASHSHHVHTIAFTSHTIYWPQTVAETALEQMLERVPASVFRLKGFLHTDAPWGWTLINMVGGRIDMRPQVPTHTNMPGTLVFIGQHLPIAELEQLCRDWLS